MAPPKIASASETAEAEFEQLEDLLIAIEEDEDYKKAIQLCEQLLLDNGTGGTDSTRDSTTTLEAVVTEIYLKSLLHESKFQQALQKKSTSNSSSKVLLLQAYAHYRLKQHDKALQAAQKCANLDDAKDNTIASTSSHIQAQALYHLHQTDQAKQIYQNLINQQQEKNDKEGETKEDLEDGEEEQDGNSLLELYTNLMAVISANATPYLQDNTSISSDKEAKQAILDASDADSVVEYPYDLAFNVATHALLTANTAPKRQQALSLLQQAHKQCTAIHSTTSNEQLQKELKPILLNETWGKLLWGEPITTTATTNTGKKHKKTNNFETILETILQPNLLQMQSSSSALPKKTLNKLQQALETTLLGKTGNDATTMTATTTITPLQQKLLYYNLALVHLHAKRYVECRETLSEMVGVMDQTSTTTVTKTDKKKKKKSSATTATSTPETLWWQVRVDVLVAYSFYYQLQKDDQEDEEDDDNKNDKAKMEKEFQQAVDKLQRHYDKCKDDKEADANTKVYLQLHLQQLQEASQPPSEWLQQQVESGGQYPAMIATMAKSFQDQNQPQKAKELLMKLNDDSSGKGGNNNNQSGNQIMAEMAMAQGHYDEAVQLYQQILESGNNNNHAIRARMVEALSHVDPARAIQEWKLLEEHATPVLDDDSDDDEDGLELEQRLLPRHMLHHSTDGGGDAADPAPQQQQDTRSHSSILRRRAKKREEYLQTLQTKGLYNPLKPTRPDPERWIPKMERQRNQRRRNKQQQQQNKGSQGVGTLNSKEAAKLDVAARATGNTGNTSGGGPSTAHMTVAGGPRKGGRRR